MQKLTFLANTQMCVIWSKLVSKFHISVFKKQRSSKNVKMQVKIFAGRRFRRTVRLSAVLRTLDLNCPHCICKYLHVSDM